MSIDHSVISNSSWEPREEQATVCEAKDFSATGKKHPCKLTFLNCLCVSYNATVCSLTFQHECMKWWFGSLFRAACSVSFCVWTYLNWWILFQRLPVDFNLFFPICQFRKTSQTHRPLRVAAAAWWRAAPPTSRAATPAPPAAVDSSIPSVTAGGWTPCA